MSAYQRFISYMYEYHGNTRHHNCGYARIDNRNQLLKLEIHMKVSASETEVPLHIYGCFQRDGQLYGIEFGQHTPMLGMVNWRMQCASEDLARTGISFNDLEGLVLTDETPVSYCSIWNDQSVQPVDLIPYPLPNVGDGSEDSDSAAVPENISASEDAEDVEKSSATPLDSEDNEKLQNISGDFSPDSTDVTTASTSAVDTPADDLQSAAGPTPEDTVSPVQAASASGNITTDTPASDDTAESSATQSSHATVEEHPRTTPTLVERILAQEFADTSARSSSPQEKDTPAASLSTAAQPQPPTRWERLAHRFPAANAFTDGELKNCLRIEPKDMPVLRREGFHIAGNRFILHCFQREPHFLFGRVGDSEQYIFAIPGIYDNQERFMANMFGFPCFRSLGSESSPAAGQKGYWYRAVH